MVLQPQSHRPLTVASEMVVDLIERREDGIARRFITTSSPSVQAEAMREYLWRRDEAGVEIVKAFLKATRLPNEELQTLFAVAAEVGQTLILRLILQEASDAIKPKTVRVAFEAALYERQTEVITFLGDTNLLPTLIKYKAIQPSIYKSSSGADHAGTPRCEMGTVEVVITAAYRNELADSRASRVGMSHREHKSGGRKGQRRLETKEAGAIAESSEAPLKTPGESLPQEGENSREVKDSLVSPRAREVTPQKDGALLRIKDPSPTVGRKVAVWRATNPPEHSDSRSFAEVVEEVFHNNWGAPRTKQLNFSGLLDKVLMSWGSGRNPLSRESLSELIEANHPQGRTLTDSVMYSWKNHPEHGPISQSVQILVEAFKLDKIHELMIWRIARGKQLADVESLIDEAEFARRTSQERQVRAQLFTTLIEASGIPIVRLQKLLNNSQLPLWKRGQSIQDPEVCAQFVGLVNPPSTYHTDEREGVFEINKRIEAFLGARPSTILDAVLAAERAGTANPTGTLLELLTGRRGIRPLTYAQGANLLGVTESVFRHMRASSDSRGALIIESQADKIVDWVQRATPDARKQLSVTERSERLLLLDRLTGIPSPSALIVKLRHGELSHAGEIVRLTRVRRGIKQEKGMSDFELGKSHVSIATAQKLADSLGFVGAENIQARKSFICFATGVDQSKTPDEIFEQVVAGIMPRYLALRRLLDLTGKSREQISETLGFSRASARIMATEHSHGRLSRSSLAIAVAREVGLLHRCREFVEVFTAPAWEKNL